MTSLWWYVARSSGLVAWALSAAAVLWGLALSTRALGRRPRAPWLLDLHRFLGGLTVVFVAVHLFGLLLDPWVSFGPLQFVVPFSSSWNPVAVSFGVVALYLLVAIEVTSLLRRHIPKQWWKGVHLSSYAMYALATVHLLTAGTDRHSPVLVGTVLTTVAAVVGFTAYRVLGPSRHQRLGAGAVPSRTVPDRSAPTPVEPVPDRRPVPAGR